MFLVEQNHLSVCLSVWLVGWLPRSSLPTLPNRFSYFSLFPSPLLLTSSCTPTPSGICSSYTRCTSTNKNRRVRRKKEKNTFAADMCKKKKKETYAHMQGNKKNYQLQMFQKQMAETNFSLFADSCATSCNKKSMNQGQTIYSNNKVREICHPPTPPVCFFPPFFL